MQEIIVNILLAVLIAMAAGLLIWGSTKNSHMTKKTEKTLGRILAATVLLLALQLVPAAIPIFAGPEISMPAYFALLALYLIDYLIIGYDILIKAIKGIRNARYSMRAFSWP